MLRELRRGIEIACQKAMTFGEDLHASMHGRSTGTLRIAREFDRPTIIVGGYGSSRGAYEPYAESLREAGFSNVETLRLIDFATVDIHQNAKALRDLVEKLRLLSPDGRVNIVGHSEGGLITRTYLTFLDGGKYVANAASIGTPHFGINRVGLFPVNKFTSVFAPHTAAKQMAYDSPFLDALNGAALLVPNETNFLAIASKHDLLVPVWSATLPEASNIRSMVIDHGYARGNHFALVEKNDDVMNAVISHFAEGHVTPREVEASPALLAGAARIATEAREWHDHR